MENMRRVILTVALLLTSSAYGNSTNYTGQVELYVVDIGDAKQKISSIATGFGGYVTEDASTQLQIAIPQDRFTEFSQSLAQHGSVANRAFQSTPLAQTLAEKKAALRSRETMLNRYLQALDQSATREDFSEVQGQLQRLVLEIEAHQSSIRRLSRQAHIATLSINFVQTVQKAVVQERDDSPFAWINTVKVGRLLEDF